MRSFYFHQIADDPFVFSVPTGWGFAAGLRHCRGIAHGRPFHVISTLSWDAFAASDSLARAWTAARHLYPEASITYVCSTQAETDFVEAMGVNALHASHNAFIDETIFNPGGSEQKRFDAVLNANSAVWKRHELAWGLQGLALITYVLDGTDETALDGYTGLAYSIEGGGTRTLPPEAVASIIRQSHCGLMLSDLEGANYASGEYLLCGVPLVTTPSAGGRHALYSSRYVKVVAPTAEAVAAGVENSRDWPVAPSDIHAEVIARSIPHRLRLLDWLSIVMERDMRAAANENAWLPGFRDKLRQYVARPDDLAKGRSR